MFAARFFPIRFFNPRYWDKGGVPPVAPFDSTAKWTIEGRRTWSIEELRVFTFSDRRVFTVPLGGNVIRPRILKKWSITDGE